MWTEHDDVPRSADRGDEREAHDDRGVWAMRALVELESEDDG
jgi:hypothetical protein